MPLRDLKKYKFNKGMTYTELIVVMSIFSIVSGITLFNYGEFQAKVDVKNLANDVAGKIVESQKAATGGQFPSLSQQTQITSSWKPAYGIFINRAADPKSFVYFVDLNNDNIYTGPDCAGECVDKILITKGNSISRIDIFYLGDPAAYSLNDITLSFVRPDAGAFFRSTSPLSPNISHVELTLSSPKASQAKVKVHASGRVQVN